MLNKSKFKAFIKNGMETNLIFDNNREWISDGIAAYSTKIKDVDSIAGKVIDQYDILIQKEKTRTLNIGQLVDVDHRDSSVLNLTNYLEESEDYLNRVFLDKNGDTRICQQKYLDVLGDYEQYRYTQNSEFSPIFIWERENLIAFVLPVRIRDRKHNVVEGNPQNTINRLDAKIDELEKELRVLRADK